jgi:hypothetical protein
MVAIKVVEVVLMWDGEPEKIELGPILWNEARAEDEKIMPTNELYRAIMKDKIMGFRDN